MIDPAPHALAAGAAAMRNVIAYPLRYPLFSEAGIVEYQLVDPDRSLTRARDYGDNLLNTVTDSCGITVTVY